MPGDLPRTVELVNAHGRQAESAGPVDSHNWQIAAQLQEGLARLGQRRDDDDALHRLLLEPPQSLRQCRAVDGGFTRHADVVARFARGVLDGVEHARRAIERAVEADDTKGLGPVRRERARREVAPVAQLVDRGVDTASGGLLDRG